MYFCHRDINSVSAPSESWMPPQSDQQKYYQLPLTRENVHFVETLDELELCKEAVLKVNVTCFEYLLDKIIYTAQVIMVFLLTLLQGGCVVGIDMEWRASFGTVSSQRVALIQLAVLGQVFLLDLCAHDISQHSATVDFIRALLSHKNIIKLGEQP